MGCCQSNRGDYREDDEASDQDEEAQLEALAQEGPGQLQAAPSSPSQASLNPPGQLKPRNALTPRKPKKSLPAPLPEPDPAASRALALHQEAATNWFGAEWVACSQSPAARGLQPDNFARSIDGDLPRLANGMTVRSPSREFDPSGLKSGPLAVAVASFVLAEMDGARPELKPPPKLYKSLMEDPAAGEWVAPTVLALLTQGPPLLCGMEQLSCLRGDSKTPKELRFPVMDCNSATWYIDVRLDPGVRAVVTHSRTEQDQMSGTRQLRFPDRAHKAGRRDGRRFRLSWSMQFELDAASKTVETRFKIHTVQFSDQMPLELKQPLIDRLVAATGCDVSEGPEIGATFE